MVALVMSTLVGIIALVLPFAYYYRRRPVGAPLSWGQAMVASTWAFLLLFWWYGVVPHQWLILADNEWNWRPDRMWGGPGGYLERLPFDINYMHARDLIAVAIYGVILAGNVAVWVIWQNRGKKKPTGVEIERSGYGRPLVKT